MEIQVEAHHVRRRLPRRLRRLPPPLQQNFREEFVLPDRFKVGDEAVVKKNEYLASSYGNMGWGVNEVRMRLPVWLPDAESWGKETRDTFHYLVERRYEAQDLIDGVAALGGEAYLEPDLLFVVATIIGNRRPLPPSLDCA